MVEAVPAARASAGCVSTAELDRLLTGSVTGVERGGLVEHLGRCRECRRRLAERRDAAEIPVSEAAPRELRARAVALGTTPAIPASARPPGSGDAEISTARAERRPMAGPAVAAAGLAAVLGLTAWLALREAPEPGVVRAPEPVIAAPRLTVAEQPHAPGLVDVRWSATPGAEAYRLVVVDAVGEVVLQLDLEGAQRRHRLALDGLPTEAASYLYVQALFDDGTRLTSAAEPLPRTGQ